jgi:hypothetical protein
MAGGGGTGTGGSADGGVDASLTVCFFDATCGPNGFCDMPLCGSPVADPIGFCRPRPQACALDCPGVCGCNGQFYCNACLAHVAGTGDSNVLTCSPPSRSDAKIDSPDANGGICGGLLGAACSANAFCDFDTTAQCGAGDQTGLCQPRPQACALDCPGVCGCNGQFYCNACLAHSAGIDDVTDRSCIPARDAN